MIGLKTNVSLLPKTGTQVVTVLNEGIKVAKTIIPGPGNRKAGALHSLSTTFANGKPQTVAMSHSYGSGKNQDLVAFFNKVWENGKAEFKMFEFIKP